ncbi:hypothetical protein JCM24511_01910 [Saitozyma sp. JCM 24511]|nr:hypothetical protein JCM24511_01910 [Saitozyma sp. JCM 24511]
MSRTLPLLPTRALLVPRASQSTVDIPSSTVVSIGLGFVAFAGGMVSILILLRMLRIYRATLRARRAGQPATFRQLWREDGGLMGFITGLGAENTGIGAGGIADLVRVRRMLEERARILEGLGKVPAMWEVQVQQKGAQNAGKADSDRDGGSLGGDTPVQAYDPLSIVASSPPSYADRAKPPESLPLPELTLSLLIALPSPPITRKSLPPAASAEANTAVTQPGSGSNADADAFDDLPELVIGTTHLLPFIPDSSGGIAAGASAGSSEESVKVTLAKGKTKSDGDGSIVHAEWAGGERRARWEKAEMAKWRIEGIGDPAPPQPLQVSAP